MDPKPTPVYKTSQTWQQETAALERFIRALRKDDADLLKEILAEAKQIFPEIDFAGMNPLSMYVLCIEMVLARKLKALASNTNQPKPEEPDSSNLPSLEWYKPRQLGSGMLEDLTKPPSSERYSPFFDTP